MARPLPPRVRRRGLPVWALSTLIFFAGIFGLAFLGALSAPGGWQETFIDQVAITWDDLDSSRGFVSGRLRNRTRRTLTNVRIRVVCIPRWMLGDNQLEEDYADFQSWSPAYGSRTGNEVLTGSSLPDEERTLAPGAEIAFTIPLQYLNHLSFPVNLTITEDVAGMKGLKLSYTQAYQGEVKQGVNY